MTAPPDMTCKSLSGKFVMNKTLSDDPDKTFILQGLSWFTRRAIGLATILLTIKEYEHESVFHIDITSVASGLSTTQEDRTLDWTDRNHSDKVFGNVIGRSRFFDKDDYQRAIPGSESERKFLLAETLKDGTPSEFLDNEHVQSVAINQDKGYGWNAEQVWGFEQVNGKRYYTRRIVCKKDDKTEMIRLVYDYQGPLEAAKDEDDGLAY